MSHVNVQRIFGRTPEKEKIDQFATWFNQNIERLEEALNDVNPINGQMSIDWQEKTDSFIVEVKTLNQEFADDIKAKFEEIGFTDWAIIGDIKKV